VDEDLRRLLAEGDEEVFLTEAELGQLTKEAIPVGTLVRVGQRDGNNCIQTWDGYLTVDEAGELCVYVDIDLWPKFWSMALGARHYLELVHRSAEARARQVEDVEIVDFDMSDYTCIRLRYRVHVFQSSTLLACVRQARDVQREIERPVDHIAAELDRTLARTAHSLSRGEFAALDVLLVRVESAVTNAEKGSALEELVAAAVQHVPNFTILERNCNTDTEEIDISVLNGSSDPLFSKEGPLVLVECKNWSTSVPRSEISSLETKIRNRRHRCTLSYFVSWADLSRKAHTELLRQSRESFIIVPINGSLLREAVGSGPDAVADLFRSSFRRTLHT
jgi:Holliday junction resolvase-like predicted endonuclease